MAPLSSNPKRSARLIMLAVVASVAVISSACGSAGRATSPNETIAPAGTSTPTTAQAAVSGSLADTSNTQSPWPSDPRSSDLVKSWTIDVVDSIPHDSTAYTQGLEVADGVLYESDGLYGESSIRTVDPGTGDVLLKLDIDPAVFGEGLTVVGDEIVQITWREGRALRWDRTTLAPIGEWSYEGEGWGLCLMGDHLLMTNGSDQLTSRSPNDFSVLSSVSVTMQGQPITYLNELECVDGLVISNIYTTTSLVVIDPVDGRVLATIDASPLLERVTGRIGTDPGNVLNGVADLGDGTLLMAGKRWPESFVVRLVEP